MKRAPAEGRYSNVSRRVWGDERFAALTAPKPNAQTLWFRLLTGPELGPIPGLFAARERGLADALGWPDVAFRRCWREIADARMAFADWAAGLVWVPKSLVHNPPHSTNVVLSWKVTLRELPESSLKATAMACIEAHLMGMGAPWGKAWAKACGKAYPIPNGEPSAIGTDIQEQEQEQEQEETGERDPDLAGHRPRDLFGDSLTSSADELPADWQPNEANRALAGVLGLDLAEEREMHAAHRRRQKYRCGAWDDDFALWLRRSAKMARKAGLAKASTEWPTDDDARLREAIRAGRHGKALAAKLAAGQLDAGLARRLVREREAERAEQAPGEPPEGLGALVAGIGRRAP